MEFITTLEQLKDYSRHIESQRDVLQFSPAFTPVEKCDINEIFIQLQTIISFKIAAQLDVFEAIEL